MKAPHITVVIPVYGCCQVLPELYGRLSRTLSTITDSFEILMVNDGSPDCAWEVIQDLAQKDERVKGINLSRNFGQHHALTAGLDFADGDWVVIINCDLQDQPEEIPKLYATAMQGYDMVVGLRRQRTDSPFRTLSSILFYKFFAYFTDSKIDHRLASFGIYSNKVIRSVRKFREQNRSFGLFALWVGFRRIEIPIEQGYRAHGRSGYNLRRMFSLAMNSMISHSNKLLTIFVNLGFLLASFSFIFAAWLVIRYLVWGIPLIGWTSLIVSIYLTAGLIITVIGITGIYIGKIFDEVKGRPLYIIESTTFRTDIDYD